MGTNNQKNDQNIIPNDADKQQKGVNVPNLRFSRYNDLWIKTTLNTVVERITRRNTNNESNLPLTISAQYGLINQNEFFNKQIASRDLTNYILLNKGEFAYNKSYSADYPWGAVKRLDKYDKGVLSSLYICFAPKSNVDSDFLVHYFETPKWYNEISNIAGEGARNHGLLNMAVSDYFNTKHSFPSIQEQHKISQFLNLINQRIDTQSKIIEKYESLIKAISNILIPKTKGKVVTLSEIAKIYQPETITQSKFNENGKYPVFGANGLIGHYNFYNHENAQICITCRGATCGNINLSLPKSWITGNSMVINTDECTRINKMYLYYLLKNYNFKSIISGSGQPQIVREPISAIKINLPTIQDQNEIVKILNTYNELLRKEKDILELYKKQKAYLLKNMFI